MNLHRRRFVASSTAALLASPFARAQSAFPDKPVRILVPFPPGGPIDQTARILSGKLQTLWNQNVLVENRVGASGIVAAEAAIKAPADGYTLLFSVIHHTVLPSMKGNLSYDIEKDFLPVHLCSISKSCDLTSPFLDQKAPDAALTDPPTFLASLFSCF